MGRPAGSKNKRTTDFVQKFTRECRKLGVSIPIRLAQGIADTSDKEYGMDCMKLAMPYVYSKQAVEKIGESQGAFKFVWSETEADIADKDHPVHAETTRPKAPSIN